MSVIDMSEVFAQKRLQNELNKLKVATAKLENLRKQLHSEIISLKISEVNLESAKQKLLKQTQRSHNIAMQAEETEKLINEIEENGLPDNIDERMRKIEGEQ